MSAKAKVSPFMAQYQAIKENYPDKLVLFRMGDFYETFYDDAKISSKVLGITLTARDARSENPTPMAGIPHHALEEYLPRLIKAGHKVAVCDQVEDPAQAKGIVKRAVTRVVTSGTLTEETMLEPEKHNYLMCIADEGPQIVVACLDYSTGEVFVRQVQRTRAIDLISSLQPDEIVWSRSFDLNPLAKELRQQVESSFSLLDDWNFSLKPGVEQVKRVYGLSKIEGLGLDADSPAFKALGALFKYLEETQLKTRFHLRKVRTIGDGESMILDRQTLRNLEIFRNQQDGSIKGSLYDCLNETSTPMGARCLGHWLAQPLIDPDQLKARHDRVEAFLNFQERQKYIDILSTLRDLERPLGRVRCQRYNARDLRSICESLKVIPELNALLAGQDSLKSSIVQEFPDWVERIDKTLKDELPFSMKEGGMVREGFHEELDELRAIATGGHNYLKELEQKLRADLDLPGLKVRQNKVFGFYIEVPKAQSARVPESFVRKQTLVNAERYIIPELKEYEDKIFGAQDKIYVIELNIVEELRSDLVEVCEDIMSAAQHLAEIDVLVTFSASAEKYRYIRPKYSTQPKIDLKDSRHPVVEKSLALGEFHPNSLNLEHQQTRVALITGPNMAGKSTFIRQIGLIQIMFQIGSFVPASEAEMSLADRVFSRVGAGDDLSSGRSTFMVEMNETANILHNATSHSLVILDEVGRGTSTLDGLSLAWAITEALHHTQASKPLSLFATHYHELTALSEELEHLRNFQVAVEEEKGKIVFMHRIEPGSADKSYGIHVAKLAGLPDAVIQRAWQLLEYFESEHAQQESKPLDKVPAREETFSLFTFEESASPLKSKLNEMDIDAMTPIQALLALRDLKEMAN